MANLYLFAIGGSGSRVLRSLTMLLASGIETNFNIIPMIIDPDASNGDLERTVRILRQYEEIHNDLNFDGSIQSRFFSSSINSLNNNKSYLLPLEGTSGVNFDKYLNISTMSKENQAFTKMLFSNTNLSSTMDVGFKGNPNIGSVVLNQFTRSNDFDTFETNFVKGDRVFIISSIFGGTGASGFPLLLKRMRTSTNSDLKEAPIGAVSLLPYFNLKTNVKSSIQADSFITKAKAALNYYEKNVTGNRSLNDMYYLGDDFSSYSYDNCDGGDDQINDAHIIEVLAALSIIDFERKEIETGTPNQTTFHEFGLVREPEGSTIFSDFGDDTRQILQRPMTLMSLLNSYLNNRSLDHMRSQRWAKDRDEILSKFFSSNFYKKYKKFKEEYELWQSELAENKLGFKPFKDDKDFTVNADGLNKVVGITPKYSGFIWKKKGYNLIDERLAKKLESLQKGMSAQNTFMELFYSTLSDICSQILNIK